MQVSEKQRWAIADELPRLLYDVFGWIAESEEEEDEVLELARHMSIGIRAILTEKE